MDATLLAAVVAALLTVVGVVGIVVPVLPGSLTIAAGLLVWAIWGSSTWGWLAFGVGLVFVLGGMAAQYLLTGRTLKAREIPSRTVAIGLGCGVIGLFVIPFFGLPIGFAAGLFASEYLRVRDVQTALSTSGSALKSVGMGLLVELACGLVAACILAGSILGHFLL